MDCRCRPPAHSAQEQIQIIKAWIEQGAEWPDALTNEIELPPLNPKAVSCTCHFIVTLGTQQVLHAPHTRAAGFQPYFDNGFPHGVDQWISAAGTNLATMALTLATPPTDHAVAVVKSER